VYKGIFQQARARVDSYQIREKVYEKYINGRLDHVDKMTEFICSTEWSSWSGKVSP
jgi:hypothetical protein